MVMAGCHGPPAVGAQCEQDFALASPAGDRDRDRLCGIDGRLDSALVSFDGK